MVQNSSGLASLEKSLEKLASLESVLGSFRSLSKVRYFRFLALSSLDKEELSGTGFRPGSLIWMMISLGTDM